MTSPAAMHFGVFYLLILLVEANGGSGRYWFKNQNTFRHTVTLEPGTPLEHGAAVRVRLATNFPPGLNVSHGRVQVRLIKAYDAIGKPMWCNNSKAIAIQIANDLFPTAAGADNAQRSVMEAAAIFYAPTEAFRVCYKNKNFTNTWQTPTNEQAASHYGITRNVTSPRFRFEINNDDYTAESWAAIKLSTTAVMLTVNNNDVKLSDQLKFVTCGTPCISHGANFRASVTQNAVLSVTQFTSSSSVAALGNGE